MLLRAMLVLLLFWTGSALAEEPPERVTFDVDKLTIETRFGQVYPFVVELALSPEQQAQGLMHRTELADDRGMLFLSLRKRPWNMWMKNTLIPLDMLFLDSDGTIVHIARMAEPMSEQLISPGQYVKGVLEIRGGLASELGLQLGDRVHYVWLRN